jgi:hypothetical protein
LFIIVLANLKYHATDFLLGWLEHIPNQPVKYSNTRPDTSRNKLNMPISVSGSPAGSAGPLGEYLRIFNWIRRIIRVEPHGV